MRLVIIISAPAAIGIAVLSNPILSLLFGAGESADIAASALSILSIGSMFLCVSSLISTVLQSLGKANIPVFTMLAGAGFKLIANYVLIAIPGIELKGAAIGTLLCYILIAVLNLSYLSRFIGFKPNIVKTYLKPLISTGIMGVICWIVYHFASAVIGPLLALGVSIILGAGVYFFLLLKTGGITADDALLLPKGEKIVSLLKLKK